MVRTCTAIPNMCVCVLCVVCVCCVCVRVCVCMCMCTCMCLCLCVMCACMCDCVCVCVTLCAYVSGNVAVYLLAWAEQHIQCLFQAMWLMTCSHFVLDHVVESGDHCKIRSMKFIQNYHNEHTKTEFSILIMIGNFA